MEIFFEESPSVFPFLDLRSSAAFAHSTSETTSSGGSARKPAHAPRPYDDAVGMAWRSRDADHGRDRIAQSDAASGMTRRSGDGDRGRSGKIGGDREIGIDRRHERAGTGCRPSRSRPIHIAIRIYFPRIILKAPFSV